MSRTSNSAAVSGSRPLVFSERLSTSVSPRNGPVAPTSIGSGAGSGRQEQFFSDGKHAVDA